MSKMSQIKISKDFSEEPAGRFPSDGEFNGETFREKYLVPSLMSNESVCIDLDGTEGYGSSFLEEAFGGLVRERGFVAEDLKKRLKLISTEDESLLDEIWDYITSAQPR